MATHRVEITINAKKQFTYNRHCVHACPGDTINWVLADHPYAVIIKDFLSPLNWDFALSAKGAKTVTGRVRSDAEYGYYPYAICAVDGSALLVDDPEIIIKPPKG